MPEAVELELGCARCGTRLTVEFEDWQDDREQLIDTSYECPFCQESFALEAAGRVVRTTPSVRHLAMREA